MKTCLPFFVVALASSAQMALIASPAYSPVVGFLKFDCPAGSDTRVSVPFHAAPRWAGKLSAVPVDQGGNVVRLAFAGSPAFAVGELTASPHFLLCRDAAGPEGRHFPIVAHGPDTVDLAASTGDLTGLAQDGLVSVIPAWTLATLFPPATQTTFHPSTGRLATQRGSEVLLFDRTTAGTNLAPSRRFYVTTTGWFEAGAFTEAGSEIIEPGQPFVIRHRPEVAATRFVAIQQVYGGKVTLPVRARQAGPQDTALGLPRPVTVKLSDLDLEPVIENSASTAPADRKDEVRVYDNAEVARNKGPLAVYFRVAGQWVRDDETSFPAAGNDIIEPSAGILIRKAAATSDGAILWVNTPRYDVTAP